MTPRRRSALPKLISFLIIVALATVIIFRQQDIFDWWRLRNYQVPAEVAALSSDTSMTGLGQKLFYVNKPQLQDKASFYVSCEENETTVVLGCYKSRQGIYLLQVEDPRLNGIEQVTAAHEMLHAAYERLSGSKKKSVGKLLTDYYESISDDSIKSKIDIYKEAGADVTNELHSILGSEVENLSPDLEEYYSQYFNNRSKVVQFASQYQSEFTKRKNKLADYDSKLSQLEKKVNTNNSELEKQQISINAEGSRLDELLKANNTTEYNAGVRAYNQSLIPYRALISETKRLIEEYKTMLDARNQVAIEAQELNKALDSRLQTSAEEK